MKRTDRDQGKRGSARSRSQRRHTERAVQDFPLPQRPVVRVDEAARILACSDNQIRALCECGRLETVKVGMGEHREHLRILTRSIRRFIGEE